MRVEYKTMNMETVGNGSKRERQSRGVDALLNSKPRGSTRNYKVKAVVSCNEVPGVS